MMQFVGDNVSESEGLEVSESDVEVSESGGKSEHLEVSESDVEVSESGGLGEFPNPRAWKFPNPTLKFPNPRDGKFPNPRAWEFPNPPLKFPNPMLAIIISIYILLVDTVKLHPRY